MPARRVTKTYLVITGPNAATSAPLSGNPSRIALFIQNTGANAGLMRFGGPVLSNGSDILFAAGAFIRWDQADTCPQESVAFSSTAATSWSVVETVG